MESTRDRIVRIATDLFVKNGFQGTGLTELSDAVGLGRGALYHHIKSKDQLHADIAYAPIRAALEEAREIRQLDLDPEAKVARLCHALSDAIRMALNPWIVFFREFSSLPADDQREILQLREAYLNEWSEVIAAGIAHKVFRAQPLVFLDGLLPMFIYVHIWETNRGGVSEQDIGETLSDFILRALRA